MKARFIEEIGTQVVIGYTWEGPCKSGKYHKSEVVLMELRNKGSRSVLDINTVPKDKWPTHCEYCGEQVSENATRFMSDRRMYNTKSGKPEPGDLYFADWYPDNYCWDNHPGPRA